eukprot:CAMPEP_0115362116 /NCGR_PEP_ID=MMETSP0270-20121206/102544_1 /TAXON_ID=71861 /ORGANISM="Scrippsiella trochoidea, Strain CCMP3099" /LENGTH=153 /DNA_ID=CAMNT_0002784687 /DNA_START=332 /DNA_END=790 /DNA_ORIENTATION=-
MQESLLEENKISKDPDRQAVVWTVLPAKTNKRRVSSSAKATRQRARVQIIHGFGSSAEFKAAVLDIESAATSTSMRQSLLLQWNHFGSAYQSSGEAYKSTAYCQPSESAAKRKPPCLQETMGAYCIACQPIATVSPHRVEEMVPAMFCETKLP